MKKSTIPKASGITLALAAAGLLGACESIQTGQAAPSAAAKTDLVHCHGVNACGGQNDCKTASNACAGKASCRGQGFVKMPSKACGNVGGAVKDDWKGAVAKADLIHCHGVNVCGGHNDCKTASNACAGKASCKGHGFVAMPAAACSNIGGDEGA